MNVGFRSIIASRVFIVSALTVYILFFVVTMMLIDTSGPGGGIGSVSFGYPYSYYFSHCFGASYDTIGLIKNSLFALGISVLSGIAVSYIYKLFCNESTDLK